MKKGLIFGLIAGAAAVAAAAIYCKKKQENCYYCDDDIDCDSCCGGDCCDCDEDYNEIPAEKSDESVIVTDAVHVAGPASEEEALDALEDEVESDEV